MVERRHLYAVPGCGHRECVGQAKCTKSKSVCRWADGEHGPCGGPVTNVGDGKDYCWDHKDVGRSW